MVLTGLVHAGQAAGLGLVGARAQSRKGGRTGGGLGTAAATGIITGRGAEGLPPAVIDMRSAMLAAVETGDIDELRAVMDLSELRPEVGAPAGVDAIAHLRSRSADGTGRDILALLGRLLAGGWAAIPGGRDIENNRIYVWPHYAEIPLAALQGEDLAGLQALAGAAEARAMVEARRYRGWRLSIGADGVWHMLSEVGR